MQHVILNAKGGVQARSLDAGDEIRRLEGDLGGAVPVRGLGQIISGSAWIQP